MTAIALVVPVVPVPLVAAALQDGAGGRAGLTARVTALVDRLTAWGVVLKLAPQGIEATVAEGVAALIARGILAGDLAPIAAQRQLLQFRAASVQQRLSIAPILPTNVIDSPDSDR